MTKTINFKVNWLLLFIIFLPTFYVFGKDVRQMQMNFFQMSIFVLIALFHVNRYIGLFLGWATFQFVFFPNIPNQSHMVQNIFFAAVLYHFIVKYADLESLKKYLWAFYGVMLLSCFWIALQANQIDPLWVNSNQSAHVSSFISEYAGFFNLPQLMGNYVAAVTPFAFVLNPLLAGFALIALGCSKSTFAVIAALTASLFFYWFRKRIVFWIILLVFGTAGTFWVLKFDLPGGQFERRLNIWGTLLKTSFQKQFTGHGIGAYNSEYVFIESEATGKTQMVKDTKELLGFLIFQADKLPSPRREKLLGILTKINPGEGLHLTKLNDFLRAESFAFNIWAEAHNEFLQVFFEFGIFGILILFGYFINLFRRFFMLGLEKNKAALALASSVVAIIVISAAHFPFHLARIAGPYLVILALFETILIRAEDAN